MKTTPLRISRLLAVLAMGVSIALSLAAAPPAEPVAPVPLTGTVAETMDAGGYTYLRVKHTQGEIWVAAKPVKLAVGDKVRVPDGWMMSDFASTTLNRKFDWILFAPAVEVNGQPRPAPASAPVLPPGHPPLTNAPPSAAAHPTARATVAVKPGTVPKAPGGYTVEECHAQQSKLEGQTVQVRGVVVKFLPNILGKNWLHLRDGTGAAGTDDLTGTTTATVKTGDTVVVKGRLVRERDFGFGYKYPVLLEDAVIIKP